MRLGPEPPQLVDLLKGRSAAVVCKVPGGKGKRRMWCYNTTYLDKSSPCLDQREIKARKMVSSLFSYMPLPYTSDTASRKGKDKTTRHQIRCISDWISSEQTECCASGRQVFFFSRSPLSTTQPEQWWLRMTRR